MIDYLYLGSAPAGEDCVSVDSNSYYIGEMRTETSKYRKLLQTYFEDAKAVNFLVKWERHDFGNYAEVVVAYNDNIKESIFYAHEIENNLPETWTQLESGKFKFADFVKNENKDIYY